MRQRTLVALDGPKPAELEAFLLRLQERVAALLGSGFRPYELEQIHATVVGLEHVPGQPEKNRNLAAHGGSSQDMAIRDFLHHLLGSGLLPLRVQLGGFRPGDRPFLSRGREPFERSFSLQGDKVVAMGWPVRTSGRHGGQELRYPPTLEQLRRAAQKHGILHA